MNTAHSPRLGVNIDHVATIRQARKTPYPDMLEAAQAAVLGGAQGLTIHLREDRRHIQDHDVYNIKKHIQIPLNLEMAATEEMVNIALEVRPEYCCLVPEKRQELTTEGGLDVVSQQSRLNEVVTQLQGSGIEVSLFIDPTRQAIEAACETGCKIVELHTGEYADAVIQSDQQQELDRIEQAAKYASEQGLVVNAGHGLHYQNVQPVAAIAQMYELNIGHSIVARALMVGLEQAVRDMKALLLSRP